MLSLVAGKYCFCGHPEHEDGKCFPRVGVTCKPHAFRETRSIMDLPTWSVSCLACGQYSESDVGEARPVPAGLRVRCSQCRSSLVEISTGRLTGGRAGTYQSTGHKVGPMPTLGGFADWD